MRHTITITAALVVFAFSCGKNPSEQPTQFDGIIRVDPQIEQSTKGILTTPTLSDFDLIVYNPANSAYSYTNTRFVLNNGDWTPVSTMLWESEEAVVDFVVFSPSLTTSDHAWTDDPMFTFAVEKEQTLGSVASDLVWCYSADDAQLKHTEWYSGNGKLEVRLTHALSRLRVEVTLGTEFNHDEIPTVNPITGLKICNISRAASIVKKAGDLAVESTGVADSVAPYEIENGWIPSDDRMNNCKAVYECIIVPQTVAASSPLGIEFSIGNKVYTWELSSNVQFETAKSYCVRLNVGKDEVVMGSDVSAEVWGDGGTSEIITE